MLRQARPVFDDGAAAVAHRASRPETAPAIAIKNLPRSGVRLVKRRNNFFARNERLIARESSRDGAVEMRFCQRILKAAGDSHAFQLAHINDEFQTLRTRAVKIDGYENPRDGDLVVLKTIPARMQVSVELQAHARCELLRPAQLVVILRVGTHVADALRGIDGVIADEAGEQRIFDGRRRKQAIVRRVNHRFCFCKMVRQANSRAGLLVCIHQVEVIVAKSKVHDQVSNQREMILDIEAGLPAFTPPLKRGKDIRIAAAVEEEAFSFAQPDKINAGLEKMSTPGVREVALDSKSQG